MFPIQQFRTISEGLQDTENSDFNYAITMQLIIY